MSTTKLNRIPFAIASEGWGWRDLLAHDQILLTAAQYELMHSMFVVVQTDLRMTLVKIRVCSLWGVARLSYSTEVLVQLESC